MKTSERLRQNKNAIFEKWKQDVQEQLPASRQVSHPFLVDELPVFFDRLVLAVKAGRVPPPESVGEVRQHAGNRATQTDYSLAELICEYAILSDVILAALEKEEPLAAADRDIILEMIHDAMAMSAGEFTERARENEQTLKSVVDNSRNMMFIKDLSGRYLVVNRSFEESLGRSEGDIRGKTDYDLFPKEMADHHRANDENCIRQNKPCLMEEYTTIKGGRCAFLASLFPLHDERGRISGIGGILTDVTEMKKLEEQLRAAIQARDDVLSIVSHELKNPLSAIQILGDLLRKSDAPEVRAKADVIHNSSVQMIRIISDLLEISRLETGHFVIEPKEMELADLIKSAVDGLISIAHSKKMTVEVSVDDPVQKVVCDSSRMLQVFSNVIGNAIKFSRADRGMLSIQCRCDGDELVCSIKDNGPGISSADLPFIFDRFWQARHQHTVGAGLGLAIAKGVIEAHHGRIWAESQLGQGTTVYFTIACAGTDKGRQLLKMAPSQGKKAA